VDVQRWAEGRSRRLFSPACLEWNASFFSLPEREFFSN
jgi:hypothetical protein